MWFLPLPTPCMSRFHSFTYIFTQFPMQVSPDSLHPHSIPRIPSLISNLAAHVLLIPTLIPYFSIPVSHVALIATLIPPYSPHFVSWFTVQAFTDHGFPYWRGYGGAPHPSRLNMKSPPTPTCKTTLEKVGRNVNFSLGAFEILQKSQTVS